MKTFSAKPTDITRKWYILDASQAPLGRLATQAAELLLGKGKPQFTPHIDCGDYVIVINASNLQVTGYKHDTKMYYRHSGHPGSLKEATLGEKMARDPAFPIVHAIRGMLPANKLRDGRLKRLKVYGDANHNHEPQKPEAISLKEGKK